MEEVRPSTSRDDNDSSDEEFMVLLEESQYIPASPKKRIIRKRPNMFLKYDDDSFECRFRLPKSLVMEMVDKLKGKLEFQLKRNNPVSVKNQILIALRYYATGSFQIINADLFGLSQPTISRIILRVSKAISSLAEEYIRMPETEEKLRKVKAKFYGMYGIPNIIGVIDGTQIPIQSPGGENAERFRNRKGWFAINTQIICDADMRIMDINARWPGSCHDQTVFNFSYIRARLEVGEFGSSYLLGDAGYAYKSYLMTPLSNPRSDSEKKFNKAFVSTKRKEDFQSSRLVNEIITDICINGLTDLLFHVVLITNRSSSVGNNALTEKNRNIKVVPFAFITFLVQ